MTLREYQESITTNQKPPEGISPALQALWWDAAGDWRQAHEVCQRGDTTEHAWVHAYLHRKEGDLGNAGYWYGRAGRSMPEETPLEEEWEWLVGTLLAKREKPKDGHGEAGGPNPN